MKKQYSLYFILGAVFLGIIGSIWHLSDTVWIPYLLKKQLSNAGFSFELKQIYKEGDHWVIDSPIWKDKKSQKTIASAEYLLLEATFLPSEWSLHLDAELVHPLFFLEPTHFFSTNAPAHAISPLAFNQFALLPIQWSVRSAFGEIKSAHKADTPLTLFFKFYGKIDSTFHIETTASFDKHTLQTAPEITASLLNLGHEWHLQGHMLKPPPIPWLGAHLEGWTSFTASFNQDHLIVSYGWHHPLLKNSALLLQHERSDGSWTGIHYFDLINDVHGGVLTMDNGILSEQTAVESAHSLPWKVVRAQWILTPRTIHGWDVELECNGLRCGGEIVKPLLSMDKQEIYASLNFLSATVAQMQTVARTFTQTPFSLLNFPLGGDLSLTKGESFIHYRVDHAGAQWDAQLQGMVEHGELLSENYPGVLQNIKADFQYSHQQGEFSLSNIQGNFQINDAYEEEYMLAGNIHFTDIQRQIGKLDLWLGDKQRDLLRIAGCTRPIEIKDYPQNSFLVCELDIENTHFADLRPERFQLLIKDGVTIHAFHLELEFQLDQLINSLKKHRLSRNLLRVIEAYSLSGDKTQMQFDYHDDQAELAYYMTLDHLKVGKQQFNQVALDGTKRGNAWSINPLKIDDLALAADFTFGEDDRWLISFLGLQKAEGLTVGLSGHYSPVEQTATCKINLFELSLDQLDHWDRAAAIYQAYKPSGTLKGAGELHAAFSSEKQGWLLDLALNLRLIEWELQKWQLKGTSPLSGELKLRFAPYQNTVWLAFSPAQFSLGNVELESGKLLLIGQQEYGEEFSFNFHAASLQTLHLTGLERRFLLEEIEIKNLCLNNYLINKGEGRLRFSVASEIEIPTKESLPTELLSPVSGTLEYRFGEEGVALTRLKQSYSKDRLFKYTLSKENQQLSYIDWFGNLHLNLHIKPNVLRYKLIEPFDIHLENSLFQLLGVYK